MISDSLQWQTYAFIISPPSYIEATFPPFCIMHRTPHFIFAMPFTLTKPQVSNNVSGPELTHVHPESVSI